MVRTDGVVSQIILRRYDAQGAIVRTETQTLNREAGAVSSIAYTVE